MMHNRTHRALFLTSLLTLGMGASLFAREFRAPSTTVPLSHDFDPRVEESFRYTVYSTAFTSQAHRAFTKHGTSTKALTALFFNEDEFRVTNAFPKALVELDTKYYNPYIRTMKIRPRAHYSEQGVHIGFSLDRMVWRERGRLGARVNVPFKTVEITQVADSSRRDSATEDVLRRQRNAATTSNNTGYAVRLDYLEATRSNASGDSAVDYKDTANKLAILGVSLNTSTVAGGVGVLYVPEGQTPKNTEVGILTTKLTSAKKVPASLVGLNEEVEYVFDSVDAVYAGLADEAILTTAERVAMQDKKAKVWLTSVHAPTTGIPVTGTVSEKMVANLDKLVALSSENVYEWFHDRGYDFETSRRVGVGDIDAELYYEHLLGDRFTLELFGSVKIPMPSGNDYSGNPYRAHLGNGEHLEAGGGLRFGGELLSWLHLNVDGKYMVALEGKEYCCAAGEETLIKNMGPQTEADIHWSSVVANADVTLVHPHTNDLTLTVGYQFMYKEQDIVHFKHASVDAWLGKKYDSTTTFDYTVTNAMVLDGKRLAANTEQFAHRAKANMAYHFSDWFTMSFGGAFTFAGQNMPKSLDWFCHCAATF